MIIAGTGHRPEDMPEAEDRVRFKIKKKLEFTLSNNEKIESIITGMAAGFDLWFADEALSLGLPIIAARPWAGHKPRIDDIGLYNRVYKAAAQVVNVSDSKTYPGAWVYPARNHWMVDNATNLLAYYTGKESGGTYECWKYAEGKIPRYNCIEDPLF